jgi:hypothetical protein
VRRSAALLLLASLLAAAGVLVASPASACECVTRTTAEYFADGDAVFTGRLLSREVRHPNDPQRSSADPAVHLFAVDGVFKGRVHEVQAVLSAESGASCGLEVSGDGPVLVFATRSADLPAGGFAATLCGGTAPLTPALAGDLESLAGPAVPPASDPEDPGVEASGAQPGPVRPALTVAGAFVLLLAGALVQRRWGRRRATVRVGSRDQG